MKTKVPSSRGTSSRKILHFEPLEERQLLAVDVFGGVLSDAPELVDTSSLNDVQTTNVALTADFTSEFTTTLAIYPQWQENVALNHWRETVCKIDPTLPIVKFQLYNQQRVLSDLALSARFGLDPDSPQDSIHEKFFPPPREHGKIVPLVFGDVSELDEFGNDPGGVMYTMSGSSGGPGPSGGGNPSGGGTSPSGGAYAGFSSIYWHTFSGGAVEAASGGGIYADQALGQVGAYNQFRIYVSAGNTTSSPYEVQIVPLDILNALESGTVDPGERFAFANDNKGALSLDSYTITFYPGESGTKYVTATVTSAYAGDNWTFRANYSSGGSPAHTDSDSFTVWRRLWVEYDQMYIPSGFDPVTGDPLPYKKGDRLAGVPMLETGNFSQACITVCAFTPNTRPYVAGVQVFDEANATSMALLMESCDSPNPINSFWTVFVVGAFEVDGHNSYGSHGDNIILIYNTEIENESTSSFYKEIVLLHELGHAFGLGDHTTGGDIMHGTGLLATQINNGWTSFTTAQLRSIQNHGTPE